MSEDLEEKKSFSQEHREKLRQGRLGKKHTQEAKSKISEALKGQHNVNAKLTLEQVKEIKAKIAEILAKGLVLDLTAIGVEYGVGRKVISDIRNNRTWKDV